MQTTGTIYSVNEITDGEKNLSTLPPQELEEGKQPKYKHVLSKSWSFILELAVVCILIVILWGLLSLPVIFYYLPQKQVYESTSSCIRIHDAKLVENECAGNIANCSVTVFSVSVNYFLSLRSLFFSMHFGPMYKLWFCKPELAVSGISSIYSWEQLGILYHITDDMDPNSL